jgi:hypothetical protein
MSVETNSNMGYGYQFIHVDWSSRIRAKKQRSQQTGHGRFRSLGWSAKDILSEAARLPGHCNHVSQPLPPKVIYLQSSCASILDVLERIDEWVMHYESQTGRKYRRDQPVMANGVISFPRDRIQDWDGFRDASVAWLKEKYRGALRCVIEHLDEGHPHIHAYLVAQFGIDEKGQRFAARFGTIHAGYAASRRARQLHIEAVGKNATSVKTGKSYTRGAPTRKAYVEAMRALQDEFYEKVGKRFSLQRLGPRAKRLAYSEHQRREKLQLAAQELADAQQARVAAEKSREQQEESAKQLSQIIDAIRKQAEEHAAYHAFLAEWSAEGIRNAAYEEAKWITKEAEGAASERIALAEQQARVVGREAREQSETALGQAARKLALANVLSSRVASAIERVTNDPAAEAYKIAIESDALKECLNDESARRMKAEEVVITLQKSYAEVKKDLLRVLEYLKTRGDETFDDAHARYAPTTNPRYKGTHFP